MENHFNRRRLVALWLGALALAAGWSPDLAARHRAGAAQRTTSPVYATWDSATVLGRSSIVRTDGGISAALQSSGLPFGQAVTMWFVVFNHPEFCATRPCGMADIPNPDVQFDALYGGGHVVGADGSSNFAGHLALGDASGSLFVEQGLPGVGLLNPRGAEVWLMLHLHGPAGTGEVLKAQLSSFLGGCEVFLGPDGVADGPEDVPVSVGECSTTQVSIHE